MEVVEHIFPLLLVIYSKNQNLPNAPIFTVSWKMGWCLKGCQIISITERKNCMLSTNMRYGVEDLPQKRQKMSLPGVVSPHYLLVELYNRPSLLLPPSTSPWVPHSQNCQLPSLFMEENRPKIVQRVQAPRHTINSQIKCPSSDAVVV